MTVERRTRKRLSPEKLQDQLSFIAEAAKRNRTANFTTNVPRKLIREIEYGEGENREVQYTAVISIMKERYIDEKAVQRKFARTKMVIERAARRKGWSLLGEEALVPGRNGEYVTVNGAGESVGDPAPRMAKPVSPFLQDVELPPLTDEVMRKYFSRIYDRESHIRIVHDNLKVALKTKFKTRHHILLKGPPACAKTELFLAFIDWLGDGLIESIDASTMTKAGLERLLLEKADSGTLKPILLLEEIEKCHPDNVSALIQVMDARGKIQRVNAHTVRDGDGVADCKIVVWSTCNDEEELRKAHRGAIWSRFGNKLDCQRPDRALMNKILHREVQEIGGKVEWVPLVLTFCFDELSKLEKFRDQYDDPRFARALLVGGDRLVDGSYFKDFRKVCGIK